MVGKRGTSLLDLLNLPGAVNTLVPEALATQLEQFSVIDYRTTTSDRAFIHYGTVQSLSDAAELPSLRNWPVEIPGIQNGIPFQLTYTRAPLAVSDDPATTVALEPSAETFSLDLFLDRVSIIVPGLKPAKRVGSADLTPRHLVADENRDRVRIYGSGVLRLSPDASGTLTPRLIDRPDPFDPQALTGAVYSLGFDPPHFFIGDSSIGLTVDQLTYDDSDDYTPEAIVARGQAPAWQGIAIQEATVYLPRNCPYVGDLSVGVRDVLLGSPTGLQGEIQIELGNPPIAPVTLEFEQEIVRDNETEIVSLGGASSDPASSGRGFVVKLHPETTHTARVRAKFNISTVETTTIANWELPDGSKLKNVTSTPFFAVEAGQALSVSGVETADDGSEVISPEVTIRFESTEIQQTYAPKINLLLDGITHQSVIYLSGSRDQLEGLEFLADPFDASDINTIDERLVWRFGADAGTGTGSGTAMMVPTRFARMVNGRDRQVHRIENLPTEPGRYQLVLTDKRDRQRRVLIEMLPAGNLLIGGESGAADKSGPISLTGQVIESVYKLQHFHTTGQLALATGADVNGPPNALNVAPDTIKEYALNRGTPSNPDEEVTPPTETEQREQQTVREVRILMDTGKTVPQGWVPDGPRPAATQGYSNKALFDWAKSFPADTQFYVIGRCDDLWRGLNTPSNPRADVTSPKAASKNKALATKRAEAIRAILTTEIPASRIVIRGEQGPEFPAVTLPGRANEQAWLIREEHPEFTTWDRDPAYQSNTRQNYRRVEIHAIGSAIPATGDSSTAIRPKDPTETPPSRRRIMIPGEDLTVTPAFITKAPALPYRVRLTVKWDSPTVIEPADAIPTQAEVLIQWPNDPVPIPGGNGENLPPVTGEGTQREVLTFLGSWSYDARSGLTVFSLGISSAGDPNGLFDPIQSNMLALALGFGPALMAALPDTDVAGDAAKLAGLVVASAVLGDQVVQDGKVMVYGIEAEQTLRSLDTLENSRLRIEFDYGVELGFDTRSLGLPVNIYSKKPIKVRYKNVGVEVDDSREGLDKFGLVYDDVSFEVEDPGQWTIDGPLGELLSVTDTRSGTSSVWYEVDLAFALDLGVVTLTGATVRLTFTEGTTALPEFELRGLALSVNVPGAITGSGLVSLGSSGVFRAGINATIIPAGISAAGSLAFEPSTGFCAIEVALILAAGIPFAQSGLGLFGFVGRFVSNGQRSFGDTPFDQANNNVDPVQKEIDWHQLEPANKYAPKPGQWALGLGAVIGTMPDTAFTFNALGMLTLGLPDPEVIFGIDARLASQPGLPSEKSEGGTSVGLRLIGIVAIDDTAIKLGIRGTFEIPKLLRLKVPISAYYPYSGDAYLRIGSDGYVNSADPAKSRLGEPVSLTILPDIIDVKAWSYLMAEESGLQNLGGNPDFSFDGFSIGFGAGWDIRWSAGPIKLEASAKVLVGIGTNPLMLVAGVFIRGELSLVVISISASAELVLKLKGDENRLDGKLCGKVDLFFFSIEGCVGISIGSEPGANIPPPASPLLKVDLTDRRGVVTGRADLTNRTGDVQEVPTEETEKLAVIAWPDTVPVIHFSHWLETALSASPDFNQLGQAPPAPAWSGTSELKYAYRLKSIRLRKKSELGTPVAPNLDAVWWLPTHRNGVMNKETEAASDQEGRLLALMSWHPGPWARVLDLTETQEIPAGDPANTLERICDDPPKPKQNCVVGNNCDRTHPHKVILTTNGPTPGPFSNNFKLLGTESAGGFSLATMVELAEESGLHLEPGRKDLPQNLPGQSGSERDSDLENKGIYRLPYLAKRDRIQSTLQFDAQIVPAITEPTLMLAICVSSKAEALPPNEVCDRFFDIQPNDRFTQLRHNNILYSSLSNTNIRTVELMPLRNEPEMMFPREGMEAKFPSFVSRVTVKVAQFAGESITVQAIDGRNSIIATRNTPTQQATEHTIVLTGNGIDRIKLTGGGGEGVLISLCYQTKGTGFNIPQNPDALPKVFGTNAQGQQIQWIPENPRAISSSQTERCAIVVYKPDAPNPDSALNPPALNPEDPAVWQNLQIQPWTYGKVFIFTCCGISQPAAAAYRKDLAYRQQMRDEWNRIATGPRVGTSNSPGTEQAGGLSTSLEHPHLLEANTRYQLDITWEWQGWRKPEDREDDSAPASPPTPPNATDWTPVSETFEFSTAQHTTDARLLEPIDFIREAIFDPRNVLRYIIGFEPATPSVPHFLKDELYVDFVVDYLRPLLAKYGYDLTLKIKLTTPPAGAMSEPGYTLLTPFIVNYLPLMGEHQAGSDQRLTAAAEAAPCLAPQHMGGTTAVIEAELLPKNEYDLILVAARTGSTDEADDVVIGRSHFRTSRYRNAEEMLDALGFYLGEPNTLLPGDAILTAVPDLPTTALLGSDEALEATLRAIKLDPWPLPVEPRTVALWKFSPDSNEWTLAGVLIETDEPIERTGRIKTDQSLTRADRLSLLQAEVKQGDGSRQSRLLPVRSNQSSTRFLLAPNQPISVSVGSVLSLILEQPRGLLVGTRDIIRGPRMAYREGLL